jgi:ribonuclease HI
MAKVLTAIVAEDMSRLVEKHQLIPTSHFGGRPGRTTTDAIHYLVRRIKEAWRKGKVASILFLDVEGAFPNAVTDRLIHNLKKRKIPTAYIGFARRLLEGRKTRLKFDDFISDLIDICNGIGQGDPLSMILYIIFNADLLELIAILQDEDAIGYVDDAIAVAFGSDFYETTQMLAHMMIREDGGFSWSASHNSRYEISKLAVLHASQRTQPDPTNPRKRIPLDRPLLQLQGTTIKEVKNYKYLGVYIDSHLRWTVQAQKGVANATKWISQFRRLTRISTVMNAKLLRQLYITVAIPKMTYALEIWYTPPTKPLGRQRSIGSVGVLRQMQKLQRMATLAIVGGMKSTPTDLLDAHIGIYPIELTLLRICHRATVRLCTLPTSHPLHQIVRDAFDRRPQKHQDPINNAIRMFELDPRKFETIAPDITPPTHTLRFRTLISETREDSIDAEKNDMSDYKIFTDGSGYDGNTGASAVLYKRGVEHEVKSLKYHLGSLTKHTTYEAEAVGALLATWLIHSIQGPARPSISLYTDSQAFIRSSTKRTSGSVRYLVDAFRSATDTTLGAVQLNWISGHSDVKGNEKADELAKQAAQGQSSPVDELPPLLRRTLPYSATAEKQAYASEIDAMWSEQWQDSPRRARMELINKTFPFKKFRTIQSELRRSQSSVLLQLRSGHIPLNTHLFRLNCVDTDKCQACINRQEATPAKETVTHFLFECQAYQYERHDLDKALGRHSRDLEAIMSNKERTRELLRYIGRTKRLKKTFGDVTQHLLEEDPHTR